MSIASISTGTIPENIGRRTLLLGTTLTCNQLMRVIEVTESGLDVMGSLVPNTSAPVEHSDCPILGRFDQLETQLATDHYDHVLVSLPLVMTQQIEEIAGLLDRLGVHWRFMPTLEDQLAGRTTCRLTGGLPAAPRTAAATMSDCSIDPARLIGRMPRPLDEQVIRQCVTGKVVMITGAGGSIGSELARIVCRFQPSTLALVERSENALFEIDREVARVFPELERATVLHDITRSRRTHDLIDRLKPDVIIHAAAHKHVPMMEDHPSEALENNFYGTRNIADAADHAGVGRFVMVSTDKAVNPSSVMGASKRLAELYVQHLSTRSETTFSMVRFGNVLGSACSVLPIWSEQITRGGPVTVTHPDMYRYFMTIPEAAGLVLQAAAMSKGGEVFLLDMGRPIRILDLARRFLLQHGFEPDVDMAIQFTGIRPGEKLFEELAYHTETMTPTLHESIRIWSSSPPDASRMQQIISIFDRLRNRNGDGIHLWQDVTRRTILNALQVAIPEMVRAAAG